MRNSAHSILGPCALLTIVACAAPTPVSLATPPSDYSITATPTSHQSRQSETTPTAEIPANPTDALNRNFVQVIPPSFFGMNTVDPIDYPKLTFGTLAHPEIGAWAWIEKSKGKYDFSLFDKYVDASVAHGLVDSSNTVSMAITLGATPPWAADDEKTCTTNAGISRCASAPSKIQDWSNFVAAVLKHYDGVTKPHIRYYELWNEMNIHLFWTGSPTEMVSLAKVAYSIVHADPHSMLLTPSVAGSVGNVSKDSGTIVMANYLDQGGAQFADGGAFHGYIAEKDGVTLFPMPDQDFTSGCNEITNCFGSIVTKATLLRRTFDQHGLSGRPMFDTEGSWGNGTIQDPDTQSAWIARWDLLQAGLYSSQNLQMAAWFTWGDPSTFHWGTVETGSRTPTPAGVAFNQVYTWLVGASINQPCSSTLEGIWTCSITRSRGYNALAIWSAHGPKAYVPNGMFVDYRDLAGNIVKTINGASLTIGTMPILLETPLTPQSGH
jgi:hypothetical protein